MGLQWLHSTHLDASRHITDQTQLDSVNILPAICAVTITHQLYGIKDSAAEC